MFLFVHVYLFVVYSALCVWIVHTQLDEFVFEWADKELKKCW